MLQKISNKLTIKTPEGIAFSLHLGGPIVRFLALSIDLLTISLLLLCMNIVLLPLGIISFDMAVALNILGYFIINIGYGIFTEWCWHGQTLGKKFLRLRVIDAQGLHLQFSQIVIRNLLRFVDSLPTLYFVGGVVCFLSRNAQRLGDIAANTVVVWIPQLIEPNLDQLPVAKYNSFRNYPHLEARLRQRISPSEAQIALEALIRRNELNAQDRLEIFQNLSSYFQTIVSFPQEAIDGISDEQYVRNVVEALFRPKASAEMAS